MKVRVEVELDVSPKNKHRKQIYEAAEYLTDNPNSILVSVSQSNPKLILVEFTIKKAKQIDVVDKIGKEFSYFVADYSTSSISFPTSPRESKRNIGKRKDS